MQVQRASNPIGRQHDLIRFWFCIMLEKKIRFVAPPFVSFNTHLLVYLVFVIFFFFNIHGIICGCNIAFKNNRDSVDVGFYGWTTLKLLSSFFCFPSFFTKKFYSFKPWIVPVANKASSLVVISSFVTANY